MIGSQYFLYVTMSWLIRSAGDHRSHLRAGGISVVMDSRGGGLPAVLHWGRDLGGLAETELAELALAVRAPAGDSLIDVPTRISLLPTPAEGWVATPGLTGSRAGRDFSAVFRVIAEASSTDRAVVGRSYSAVDEHARLGLRIDVELTASGLLRIAAEVDNRALDDVFELGGLVLALPVPTEADELFDLTGRHARERVPQRGPFRVGTWLRESRKGKPGLDASYLLAAGVRGFGFTTGEIWAVHVGWSGNQLAYAERTYNGISLLGGGELLLPGEIRLAPARATGRPGSTPPMERAWAKSPAACTGICEPGRATRRRRGPWY